MVGITRTIKNAVPSGLWAEFHTVFPMVINDYDKAVPGGQKIIAMGSELWRRPSKLLRSLCTPKKYPPVLPGKRSFHFPGRTGGLENKQMPHHTKNEGFPKAEALVPPPIVMIYRPMGLTASVSTGACHSAIPIAMIYRPLGLAENMHMHLLTEGFSKAEALFHPHRYDLSSLRAWREKAPGDIGSRCSKSRRRNDQSPP